MNKIEVIALWDFNYLAYLISYSLIFCSFLLFTVHCFVMCYVFHCSMVNWYCYTSVVEKSSMNFLMPNDQQLVGCIPFPLSPPEGA